ncbi:hypothetical protein N1851_028443 [Merluccius polli]|uniref:Uncharacterized protein n=1 Tax=Merluccius polli TaxID=89951 RepID=A0AA47M8Q6_MERPO|nr:hypothetical protein N1851_028443 [Merluccius polli]
MFMSIGLQRESSSKGRRKWTEEEVQAVEKMLKTFIISRKVPGKQDCERCIESSPQALQYRDWKAPISSFCTASSLPCRSSCSRTSSALRCHSFTWLHRDMMDSVATSSSRPPSFSSSSSARPSARLLCSCASRRSRWASLRSSCRPISVCENFSCWASGSAPANCLRSAWTVAGAAPPVLPGEVEGALAGVQALLGPEPVGLQGVEAAGQGLKPAERRRLAELQRRHLLVEAAKQRLLISLQLIAFTAKDCRPHWNPSRTDRESYCSHGELAGCSANDCGKEEPLPSYHRSSIVFMS